MSKLEIIKMIGLLGFGILVYITPAALLLTLAAWLFGFI